MAPDLSTLAARARRAYEWSRLRRASLVAVPLGLLVLGAAALASQPLPVVLFGAALVAEGVASLWWGHGFERGLVPGVLAGLLPFGAITCAAQIGHACAGSACYSICLSTSTVGGVAAGLAVGTWALRRAAPWTSWSTACSAALLTGSLGCTCTGWRGLAALGLGFCAAVPFLVLTRRGAARS